MTSANQHRLIARIMVGVTWLIYRFREFVVMRQLLEHFQDRALDAMSSGSPAHALMCEFAVALQAELPGCIVGINVLDKPGRTFRISIFPSLPAEFGQCLENNVITGERGSCGLGILTGKMIEAPDVANDERFSVEWKMLFHQHKLTSLVSIPALTPEGTAQGSLAVIHPFAKQLNDEQIAFLKQASALCAKICAYSRTQESSELLIGELEHRSRNLFLTVAGIANLTIKSYPDPSEFRRVFGERLMMMHRAQSFALSASQIDIASLIQEILAPYAADCDIKISGPDILLAKEAASALALVVHELGTNAAKYGALSRPEGKLHVTWLLSPGDDDGTQAFKLLWEEGNGPQVEPPTRQGYGTRMMRGNLRNAFDGAAALIFEPSGLRCEIRAPFTHKLGTALHAPAT